jgi:hypothetical protein
MDVAIQLSSSGKTKPDVCFAGRDESVDEQKIVEYAMVTYVRIQQ